MSAKLYARLSNSKHPQLGPLECHLSAFTLFLQSKDYSAVTLRKKLRFTCHFSRWLGERALNVCDLNEQTIKLFFEEPPKTLHIQPGDFTTLCLLLEYLREMELIPLQQAEDCKPCSVESEFELYLQKERGLSPRTVNMYMPTISSFLREYSSSDLINFSKIHTSDITRFVVKQASTGSRSTAQHMTSVLRVFFRFLRYRGDITSDLAAAVPTVAGCRT